MEDQRFAHVVSDPKFRRIPKTEGKVKIDKRFKSMFKDQQFKVKYTVDKRGRPVSHTSNEDLKRYYELASDESSIESENEEAGTYVKAPSLHDDDVTVNNELNLKVEQDPQVSEKVKKKLQNLNVDYARGESNLFSESSSDEEESATEDEDDLEHAWGALDADAERTDDVTNRLAACNMDWDRIRATDLMVLLNSFLPTGGLIESVKIYPSEFGKERMAEEEIKGPVELVDSKPLQDDVEDEEEGEEGSKYHMEKLRQYQLNRLKYYYAVIVCDNKNTANKIYTECDGLEYESSATKMDLRFIPDDVTFDEIPKEVCEKLPEPGKYKPRFFTTTALQQAKVDLTWDETNPDRIELSQKIAAGDEVTKADLQSYLASSSSEDEENEGDGENVEESLPDTSTSENVKKLNVLNKYKLLLQDIENQENEKAKKGVEMEISWEIDLKGKTEKLVTKKLDEKEEKTPFQQYLDKRKEKQKAKREERKKQQSFNSENDSDIPSDIDMNDPYFAEEFNKAEFREKKSEVKNSTEIKSEENVQKAAELELLLMNIDDNKRHFSLQKIQSSENESVSKKKSKKKKSIQENVGAENEDDFKINVADARFSALYSSHHYNVDPTDSHYKKTKAMEAIVHEKLKRRTETVEKEEIVVNNSGIKKDAELSVLVKSVKRKTEALGSRKKQKVKF